MATTATMGELLQSCVQDLHAARRVAIERLPAIIEAAGPDLRAILQNLRDDYAAQAREFEATEHALEGPENLWMAGVMDDAERDTQSIVRGVLLDVALVGAVRKGVAADAVSLETAVAVARSLGRESDAGLAQRMRDTAASFDERLRLLLQQIA